MAPARLEEIVSFLKLYPNMFEIQGSGPNIQVFVAKPLDSPRPVVPRPVQVSMGGGASSSNDPAPHMGKERQPRTIEIDPRAPHRRFPNEQRVEYGANAPG